VVFESSRGKERSELAFDSTRGGFGRHTYTSSFGSGTNFDYSRSHAVLRLAKDEWCTECPYSVNAGALDS
jgi:hypothetical protein